VLLDDIFNFFYHNQYIDPSLLIVVIKNASIGISSIVGATTTTISQFSSLDVVQEVMKISKDRDNSY